MESNPLHDTLEQRLANLQYKNWVKAVMCLSRLKEGLEDFAQKESEALHYDIWSAVKPGPCGRCIHINQLCPACGQMKREIEKRHTSKPCWTNTDVQKWSDWPNSNWYIAKCYMNDGQKMTNSAKDSDISSLLNFIINCKHFQSGTTYGNIQINANKVRDKRNKIIHSGDHKLSESDLTAYADNMLELLKDEKPDGKLKGTQDAENAEAKIEEILKASFVIMLEDETKARLLAYEHHTDRINELEVTNQKLKTEFLCLQANQDQRMDQTITEVMSLRNDVEKMKNILDKSVEQIYTRIEQDVQTLGGKVQLHDARLQKLDVDVRELVAPIKRRPESDGLRQLKNRTEDKLDTLRKLKCIPTTQAEEAKRLLEGNRSVVIKGNPGEGKTTLALHLIDNEMYRDRRVVLCYPRDWEKVDTDWVSIVILEDILGTFDLDTGYLQEWMVHLPTIQEHIDAGKLRVIITTRLDILSKTYFKIRSLKLFSDDLSLTLSSEQLKHSEKMSILNRELLRYKRNIKEHAQEKCITNFSGLIGFPQCCSLFAGDSKLFDKGPEFFRSPNKFFVANITGLADTRFLSLAFLFCNGEIFEEYLSPETMPESTKCLLMELASHLQISEEKASVTLLREAYDSFLELYVSKFVPYNFSLGFAVEKPCIWFTHATVLEAVGQVLGERCPEMVIKYGDSEYLYQRTCTAEANDGTSQNVCIPVSVYGLLAKRMVQDVEEKRLLRSVVKHSALKQLVFLNKLKDELHKGNKIMAFFTAEPYSMSIFGHSLSEGECITFMQYILQSDEDVVRLVYGQFLEFFECAHDNNSTDCWQCKEKQKLLELALYYHHFHIADKLITMKACYTHVSLCNAARHGDLRRVRTIIESLKRSHVFNPECEEAKDALCRAYVSGNQSLIECLLNESIKLNSRHVVDAVQHGDINVLMKIVEHLKGHKNWNPHSEHAIHRKGFPHNQYFGKVLSDSIRPYFNALYITYCKENFHMADYLLKNEVKVSMDLLMYLSESRSKQAVAKLIKNLKVAGTWDPRCHYASKALENAYIAQNVEVLDLLVQKGVSLKITSLTIMVIFQASLEYVKKAIQHLKDTGNWDSKCDDASKALEIAYINQKCGVVDLLVQEGVTLRMKNLPGVVYSVSLEYVKKAIQHLKNTENWDSKCDDASKALEISYIQQKYDVLDLLIQEGVTLTMKNLPGVIMGLQVTFESVTKAIQHLKDTDNWDSKCDDASKALEIAYSKQERDACVLLVQEGLTLTMKNLPFVVANSVSLESVKKTIQHLKDTDNWDSKCDDASKALEIAYGQHKHDVCALLVQEGLTLTMKTLPFVVANTVSLEYVKKTIQHLKDTDNWDSKCDDASKILEIAYSQQKYDLCAMLVQEGFTLKMTNLPFVVANNVSLESVKKTIQHLKDSDTWDSKCDDASKALGIAYVQHKYDVCDLLVQEGLTLTMKTLLVVVVISRTLKSIKKAIQHLKDTDNWDSKCDDASGALGIAYGQQKFDMCALLVQEGLTLTMKTIPIVVVISVSLESVKKAIHHLKDTDTWDSKCDDASGALGVAYGQQKYDVCALLVQEGVTLTMKSLSRVVVNSVSLECVKKAIQHLKDTDNWDSKCDDASKALGVAYCQQKYDVCSLLFQEGLTLTMKTLPFVMANSVSLESVKKAIQHLKDTDNWDSKCDDASIALVLCYHQQKYDICALLVQEGLTLTMKILLLVVASSVSLVCVNKAIQHLKDTDNWDSKCDDASGALGVAYGQQKYDVCALLVQEGLTLTMKTIAVVVENSVSLECLKEAIQHLKDTDTWDSKCDDALEALGIAYAQQKYDVCSLLFQEGLTLTMKSLPCLVVKSESLESVKKAIQHLKDTDNWDSNSDDALEAMGTAYGQGKYDVCALLVQEKLTLTMRSLPFVVVNSESLESVKKAIQHLKDTFNWDSNSNDALEAMGTAYGQGKYDVCALLVQEKLTLTMRSLPFVVVNSKSLESVKKAIQHLKDTDNWNLKCDYSSEALGIAYYQQKYDVCTLLVQEGVILTMTILPDVVRYSVSLKSVKKAIQLLKDTDNWDSKCDDALNALEIAYYQQKYDVCALLVQEGLILTMKSLPGVVVNSKSLASIKKAIQNLKDTGNWNSKCDDASEALEMAWKQKHDVCDLLVEEGVTLRMKTLAGLLESVSLEYVNKAIQHLKDTDNWDSKCDDACAALGVAYGHERYDVCALLVQQGLTLTMKSFFSVVAMSESLESVKKAIQRLKVTDNWDSKCEYASCALGVAYGQQMYDVFALLVQEKLTLTMKSFIFVVFFSNSLESVKKAMQLLKDTDNWDSKCDDASEALAAAYYQQKYDVCALLVQEGLILTMKNLPDVVVESASLESIKKAIQHLKDTGNWNSRCADASKALEMAWKQEHDVCDLLVQEGVTLRMKNLAGLVDSVSLESVKKAIQHLKDTDNWDSKCDDAFETLGIAYGQERYDVCALLVWEEIILTMKSLPSVVVNSVSSESVKKAIQDLKDTDNWDSNCDDALEALVSAYSQDMYDVCTLLDQEGLTLTMKSLTNVVISSESLESVTKAIQHLKDTGNWDSNSDDALEALGIVYGQGKYDVCALLVQEKLTLVMKSLPCVVVNSESLESVKKAIQHLKDTNNWNSKCDDALEALGIAYYQQKYDVCALLVQEGVILTMKNLPEVVGNSVSLKSVKKAMQLLKDTGKWDSKCDDALEALEIAYYQQKYNVCALLVQEGFILTMKNLPDVVVESESLESIKRTLQHLKDTGNWNSKCDDASKALEMAWKQKHDVCDLLVEEGVTLRMKNLAGLVVSASLEYVNKAIQHLKDTENWDSKCDDAFEALGVAYGQEKYDVCALLFREELVLTMKNFVFVVRESESLKSVKKATQHLKDSENWDSKCDDASRALGIAYGQQKDDVCSLLFQEGLTLTMKSLPYLVATSESLESVTNALHHLKDTDNWDPNSDDALEALVAAYGQGMNDVCVLLVQEKLTLTMKSLPFVVAISVSLESVKKAIQHLKDTDNWDSKCEYALNALWIAYYQQKYDVCDWLVLEELTITMKNLAEVVQNSASLEPVKKAIQHLKDTDNWDAKCDDASNALEIAYYQQKYDVCAMMVQEGFILTMKNLPGVVKSESLASIKKAIQYLKDTGNWNSKCDDASEALEMAWKQKQDVCDLLVQERVTLRMKNLAGLVVSASLESVKKVIQHLKDSENWDSKCDDASRALLFAYGEQKDDVCSLLFQEGLKLTMRNLPVVVATSVSLESVKKAIQHLKYTDNWDSKCDQALLIAYYEQKYDVCSLLFHEGLTSTMRILPFVVAISVSLESVKKLIQHLKDTDKWDSKCVHASIAIHLACVRQKYNVFDLLVQEGVSLTLKSVKKAIQDLKDTDNWDSKSDDASEALGIDYDQHNDDVCALLVQEGPVLSMKNIADKMVNFLQKAIQDLKDTNNWDSECDDASITLSIDYGQQKDAVCSMLFQEELALTMKNLPFMVANSESLESVKKAMQHLKDTDNWDCKCDDALHALVMAYSEQKYDVCVLLVQEGLTLTMKNLADVVVHSASLESVKKAIQHLKDSDRWDSKYDDGLNALVIACINEKYDVCSLLFQAGLTLRMKNLADVAVYSVSLEPVKKAILHLKDTGNWDSKCDDALKGLGIAYIKQKYDVCALFVQGGLTLTMKNLPFVVANSESLESVKKAIQHLKDTDHWDCKCDDALNALVMAYSQQKYDMCALLVQRGLTLTMKNLPYVVEHSVVLMSVKKAIQHLKDTDNWESKSKDAFKALEIARCQQKYNVCALLVQEGLTLTM